MKNIFKKNQIIIAALAVMIVIAGYLTFTREDTLEDGNTVETTNPDTEDYEEFTETDGLEVVTNTDNDNTTTDTTNTTDTDDTTDTTDTDDTNEETAAANDEDTEDAEEESDELGDISDEDLLETAQDVSDNGQLDLEEGVPGEAVLASAAIDASYFISRKIDREQVRSKSRERLKDILDSAEASEENKQIATSQMLELNDIADKESLTEMLLEAKGFDGTIVFISDGAVDVVVNAETLSDQQLAIIEKVVKEKTDIAVEHISINPAVVEE